MHHLDMEYYNIPLLFVLFFTALFVSTSQAFKLDVGGSDGWTLNPSENYNHWAGRYRFQINDVLVFKYKKGSDSVLEVKKEDYEKCNKTNPIKKFDDGETEFTLDKSGPFYFISGKDENCEKGQKLTLVVISPRKNTPPSVPTPTSSPSVSPSPPANPSVPAGGPTTSSPSPVSTPHAGGPTTSPPSPVTTSPASGPTTSSPSPVSTPPAGSSPSPVSTPPAGGPTTSSPSPLSTPPAGGPTTSSPTSTPMAGGPPAPSPGSLTPEGSPTSQSPGSSSPVAPGTPTLGPSGTENAKAPSGSSGNVGPPSFVVYSVTVVVGALFLSY